MNVLFAPRIVGDEVDQPILTHPIGVLVRVEPHPTLETKLLTNNNPDGCEKVECKKVSVKGPIRYLASKGLL